MLSIGLTGGIGSGKSTVSTRFQAHGIDVVDADIVARDIVKPGSDCLDAIRRHFGDSILHPDGTLNRAALRARIFANEQERMWLEALTHPEIRRRILQQMARAQSPYAILSAPLLLESGHYSVDRVLVVDVPVDLQISRASARDGNSLDAIKAIISKQMSRPERLKRADDIIDNSGSLEQTLSRIDQLHHEYLTLAKGKE